MQRLLKLSLPLLLVVAVIGIVTAKRSAKVTYSSPEPGRSPSGLPMLVGLGSGTCIPCKMMAPILQQLKKEYVGRLDVVFVDVGKDPAAAKKYAIQVIPTQIFYDPSGKELFRHPGFFAKDDIIAKWKQLGFDLDNGQGVLFERLVPAKQDDRPKDQVCFMCDGDVNDRTAVAILTGKGPVRLCGIHCYFIMYSCLTQDKAGLEEKVTCTDWATGQQIPFTKAIFLYGHDQDTGRPWIKAFADMESALKQQAVCGGSIIDLDALATLELSHRCGFCDRACYPQDAAKVIIADGIHTWGCCCHCALGVAARTGKDIEVHQPDRLTGQPIVVKTFEGRIASIEPSTAVAWFGQRQQPDGEWVSAGCFHQGFFSTADNLKGWVERNPYETGRLIPIAKALADKMRLSPKQIKNACKIGECAPK